MKFPYAMNDFGTLIQEGYFYQDRTDWIPRLEEAGYQLIFIRPRRFGKSLLLSMLEHYYDLNRGAQFETLFGHLAIGKNPGTGSVQLLTNQLDIFWIVNNFIRKHFTTKKVPAVALGILKEGLSWEQMLKIQSLPDFGI